MGKYLSTVQGLTCTMAMRSRTPLSPTANEAAAMIAGPVRNLTPMEKTATEFPQAIILGCNAMNKPTIQQNGFKQSTITKTYQANKSRNRLI